MRKKFKMDDSQSPPENQLKRHVLVRVTATLFLWKVNLATCAREIWGIFLVSHISTSYYTCLKTHEINSKNMKNSKNICRIALGTVR